MDEITKVEGEVQAAVADVKATEQKVEGQVAATVAAVEKAPAVALEDIQNIPKVLAKDAEKKVVSVVETAAKDEVKKEEAVFEKDVGTIEVDLRTFGERHPVMELVCVLLSGAMLGAGAVLLALRFL